MAAVATVAVHEVVKDASEIGDPSLVDAGMKNAKGAWCRVCACHILSPRTALLVRRKVQLPVSRKVDAAADAASSGVPEEELFWHLDDMMDFMNIGFTRNAAPVVGETERPRRFLTCADCEKEVLGFQFLDEPKNFYLSFNRVVYEVPPPPSS